MDGLKQRVIGALVLVSLAVIFVPMLFDEPHSERSSRVIDLPEEPPFPEVNMPEPAEPVAPEAAAPDYRLEEVAPAPESPVVESAPVSAPVDEPVEESAPATTANTSRVQDPEPEVPASTSSEQPISSADYSNSLEGAWIVQLGSFGNAENARRLRDQAREKGYSSHLQEIARGDSVLTRVFCGPFAEKTEAERAKRALDSAFGLNSLVTSGNK